MKIISNLNPNFNLIIERVINLKISLSLFNEKELMLVKCILQPENYSMVYEFKFVL